MKKKQIAITFGIVCCILMIAVFMQIKTISNANKVAQGNLTNNDLRDQVLRWKEKYDIAYSDLQDAEKELENIRQEAANNTEGSKEKEDELKKNNMLLGITDVSGEGVIITVRDNSSVSVESISATEDIATYLVHYSDVLNIVNELKNAGAEAISINDERVVSSTAITCEGNVINVNGKKVGSPFNIKAIGNSLRLYSALTRPAGYVELLKMTGIPTTVKQAENIEISKYAGVINSKYIRLDD